MSNTSLDSIASNIYIQHFEENIANLNSVFSVFVKVFNLLVILVFIEKKQ